MSSAACVGESAAVKKVAMLRQTPLEMTRESRPGDNRLNHFLAFAELMLRRGVGELAGGGEAPEPPVTTNDTNLRRSFLTCCLMFVNLTGLRRGPKGIPADVVTLSHQSSANQPLPARARKA